MSVIRPKTSPPQRTGMFPCKWPVPAPLCNWTAFRSGNLGELQFLSRSDKSTISVWLSLYAILVAIRVPVLIQI